MPADPGDDPTPTPPAPSDAGAGSVIGDPQLNEADWIRHRIGRLRTLLPLVSDERALKAIRELIAEASARLDQLNGDSPERR